MSDQILDADFTPDTVLSSPPRKATFTDGADYARLTGAEVDLTLAFAACRAMSKPDRAIAREHGYLRKVDGNAVERDDHLILLRARPEGVAAAAL